MGLHGSCQEEGGEHLSSMSETSHVLGSLLASSPLLALSWRHCAHASAVSSSFVVEECDGAVYVAFSGAVQALPPAASAGVGFFSLVPVESAGRGRELFAQLERGGNEDGDQPVLLMAGALHLFTALYHTAEFQMLIAEIRDKAVIFTGHSIGGCLASLAALYFLCLSSQSAAPSPASLLCITFGSPLLGNEQLSCAVRRERWGGKFCHVVAQYDIMPRLLFCPLDSSPPQCKMLITNLMQSWLYLMRYPQLSRGRLQLSDEQKAELCQYISTNVSGAASEVRPYRPFGNYAFCSAEGSVCINDPIVIVKMMHLTFITCSESLNFEEEHISYGDLVTKISHNLLLRKGNIVEEVIPKSQYSSGVSLAIKASGIRMQDMHAREAMDCFGMSKMCPHPNLMCASLSVKLAKVTPCRAQIEWYKVLCDNDIGYYDCFKLRKSPRRDAKVNMNRIKLANFWNDIIIMLQNNELPYDFLKRNKWVNASQSYMLLVEPLDIAEYYRQQLHKTRGHYLTHGRPRRYELFDRWWADENESINKNSWKRNRYAGFTQDPCFWAKVEEASDWLENARTETDPGKLEELHESLSRFECYAKQMIDKKEVSEDVLAPQSSYSIWAKQWKELQWNHLFRCHLNSM